MKKQSLKATTLTSILIGIIFLIVAVTVVANWQLQKMLSDETTATNNLKRDAEASSSNLAKAKNLETYMNEHQADVARAASIVAQSQTYQYQNQIIEDITRYANSAGLRVLEFSFPDESSSGTKKQTGGLKSISVQVSLARPTEYLNFLRFLKFIEQNLTKMQVTEVSVRPSDDNPALIEATSLSLEVYVK